MCAEEARHIYMRIIYMLVHTRCCHLKLVANRYLVSYLIIYISLSRTILKLLVFHSLQNSYSLWTILVYNEVTIKCVLFYERSIFTELNTHCDRASA